METTWIVLANAARARIFESVDGRAPTEVRTLAHPGSRLKAGELAEHHAGHAERHVGVAGHGSPAYPPSSDPRDKEHQAFGRELAQVLHAAVAGAQVRRLVLSASSDFLGVLRGSLDAATTRAVVASHAADLTELPALELQQRLAALLAEAAPRGRPAA